jgi:hypothetical protein
MTLLKFAVTLLSTMVVAVDLSSKPANSHAFAQLDQTFSSEKEFRGHVQNLSDEIDALADKICDAKKAASRAYKKACDYRLLKKSLLDRGVDPTYWEEDYGYSEKEQDKLDAKNAQA